MDLSIYLCLSVSMSHVHVSIWQRLNNIGLVTGSGGLFATRLVRELGSLATNPPCDKPIEYYSTLHRGPRQGFVTQGPRQRFVAEGGHRDKLLFRVTAICVYIGVYSMDKRIDR